MKNNRNSTIDLLKIILTLMVITLHYFSASMGGLLENVELYSLNYYLCHILESMFVIAVNVFVLITGYLSCQKTKIKISKPIMLYSLAIFYGLIILGSSLLFGKLDFNALGVMKILQTIFDRWFITIFCLLYLLIPFINKLIKHLSQKDLKTLLIINAIFFYLWHTFFTKTTIADGGYGIINFVNLYMIGAYIKLYSEKSINRKKCLIIYIFSTLMTLGYSFLPGRAWAYATIFNLISSVAFFEFFLTFHIKSSTLLNKMASYSLSSYIIHENLLISVFLYQEIFQTKNYWNSNLMIFHLIFTVIGIYLVCVLLEFIRRTLFGKIFDDSINKIEYEICCK